jgi:hypothetical protein
MTHVVENEGDVPVVTVGARIAVHWPDDDGHATRTRAEVQSIKKSSKKKHGTCWKYTLCLLDQENAVVTTRLGNVEWELLKIEKRSRPDEQPGNESKRKKKKNKHESKDKETTTSEPTASASLELPSTGKRTVPPECLRYIVAPMVGGSELAFRLLCRKYGATIAYTPMMNSEKFAAEEEYRQAEFQTTPQDRPLVAHFSANNPKFFLDAAKLVQDQCDAIGEWQYHCMSLFVCCGVCSSLPQYDADVKIACASGACMF